MSALLIWFEQELEHTGRAFIWQAGLVKKIVKVLQKMRRR